MTEDAVISLWDASVADPVLNVPRICGPDTDLFTQPGYNGRCITTDPMLGEVLAGFDRHEPRGYPPADDRDDRCAKRALRAAAVAIGIHDQPRAQGDMTP